MQSRLSKPWWHQSIQDYEVPRLLHSVLHAIAVNVNANIYFLRMSDYPLYVYEARDPLSVTHEKIMYSQIIGLKTYALLPEVNATDDA